MSSTSTVTVSSPTTTSTTTTTTTTPTSTSAPTTPPAVQSVSMDADGNLLVNGQPFLWISGQKTDYWWWTAAGYTLDQTTAKLGAMASNGVNVMNDGNWGLFNGTYQDTLLWQNFGIYWAGSAVLDDQGHNAQGNWADTGTITTIVNEFKSRPNLLRWYVATELNPEAATTYPTNQPAYGTAVSAIGTADPAHPVAGDLTVFDTGFNTWIMPSLNAAPIVEETVGYPTTGITIQHIMDAIFSMRDAWNAGQRFVAGISITPIPELNQPLPSTYPATSVVEMVRAFFWPIALNVKAFEVLWGANQRTYTGANTGDSALPPGAQQTWSNTLTALSMVRAMQPVIVAPGRFAPVPTTPAFTIPTSFCNNVRSISGIYAAAKQVGTTLYVVAVNVNEAGCQVGYPAGYNDTAVSGATINVGASIVSVTRMFEGGSPSFSGGVITDDFAPMGVHVYKISLQ